MNSKSKNSLFRIPITLLLLGLGLTVLPAKATMSVEGQEESDIKKVVDTYFTLRYEARRSLASTDFLAFTEATDVEAIGWRQSEADRLDIRFTIARTFEDYVIDYKFSLYYVAIDVQKGKAIVTLLESNEITYSSNPTDPSRMADLRHVITLEYRQGKWVVQKDEYQDELSMPLASQSPAEIKQIIRDNYNTLLQSRLNVEETPLQVAPAALTRYTYANSAALSYSNSYWNSVGPVPATVRNTPGWNSSWPTSYKLYAKDCNNFISQAIFQGTSFTNSDANYFYPDSSHYSNWWYYKFSTTVDGSSPWVNVGSFYTFLTGNLYGGIGRGPAGASVGICSTSLIYGNPIFMKSGGSWAHSVIVATNSSCNITVNSHTVNYYHTPLSTYSAYTWYPIYIAGYFK